MIPMSDLKVFAQDGRVHIDGVGPLADIVTNEKGGRQSSCPYSFVSSFPNAALLKVAKVVRQGLTKYAPDNWRLIAKEDHLNHAITHLHAWAAGDRQDEHLEHAACRLLMAIESEDEPPPSQSQGLSA